MQGYQPGERRDYTPAWEPGESAPMTGGAPVRRSQPWKVALTAMLTLLVLILALGNQTVTDTVRQHADATFRGHVLRADLVYAWRFSPDGDVGRAWTASLAFLASGLVLTLLLTAVLTRGRGGFGQLFVAGWVSVVVAVLLAGYVRALVIDHGALQVATASKATAVFFSALSPNAYTLSAGIGYGVVVALIAAAVGVSTRRTDIVGGTPFVGSGFPPPAVQPDAPAVQAAPWAAASQDAWATPGDQWASPREQWSAPGPVTRFDRAGDGSDDQVQHTAVLPAVRDDGAPGDTTSATPPASPSSDTAALPRAEAERPASEPTDERADEPASEPADERADEPADASDPGATAALPRMEQPRDDDPR